MRIAQVAPLFESVPPRGYGGTERVVAWLTDELVRRGHEVTLFATADSRTGAELVPCAPRALRNGGRCLDGVPWHVSMLERVASRASGLDVIHFHCDVLHLPLARRLETPSLTTLHGRLDQPGLEELYDLFGDAGLVSISDAQRAPIPHARWLGTVHHGLPLDESGLGDGRGDYLVFLGRISRDKRPDRAIEIAQRAGMPLKIAAKVDAADRPYFEREIRGRLEHPLIEMLGERGEADKATLLGGARALLFPIDWPEPFGLVMIEAMARGTPVIAFRCGSVPEIVEHGVTGFVVDDLEEAVDAVRRAGELDRAHIRRRVALRFSVSAMTDAYLRLYQGLVTERSPRPLRRVVG